MITAADRSVVFEGEPRLVWLVGLWLSGATGKHHAGSEKVSVCFRND